MVFTLDDLIGVSDSFVKNLPRTSDRRLLVDIKKNFFYLMENCV